LVSSSFFPYVVADPELGDAANAQFLDRVVRDVARAEDVELVGEIVFLADRTEARSSIVVSDGW
jgi:hypothetical protein